LLIGKRKQCLAGSEGIAREGRSGRIENISKHRTRFFLKSFLSAEGATKHRYYEAVEGASAACHPGITNPTLEDAHIAEATAEAALKVVKKRSQRASDSKDDLAMFLTDAYATVAVAYRRAAGVYAIDDEMQKLGTAAVHLLTMATSHMKAHPDESTS
jgi:hypothetical protein